MAQDFDESKLRELILHVARCSEGDPNFGAVKLNKVLFYADFLAYRKFGHSLTGAEYQKLDHGPAPRVIKPVLEHMEHAGMIAEQIVDRFGYTQKRIVALREPVLSDFSGDEIALVDQVIGLARSRNARRLSDESHLFVGWRLARLGETIPYAVALIRKRPLTERERAHGLSLVKEAEALLAR